MICTRNKNEFMEMLQGNEKHFYRTHIIPEKGDPDTTIVVSVLQPCAPLMLMRPSTSLTLQPSSPISDFENENSHLKDNKELLNSWRKLGLLWFCISSYDLPARHTLNCTNADEIFNFSLA